MNLDTSNIEWIFKTTAAGICYIDEDLNIRCNNGAMEELFNVSPEQLRNSKCYQIVDCPYVRTSKCLLNQAKDSKKPENRIIIRERAGLQPVYLLVTAIPVHEPDGNFKGIVEDFKDITKQMEAEKALENSGKRFRSTVESAFHSIGIIDDQFTLIYANSRLGEIFGLDRDALLGKDFRDFIAAEDLDMFTGQYLQRQAREKVPGSYQFKIEHNDGTLRLVEISAAVINTLDAQAQIIFHVNDITDHNKLQRDIADERERLSALINDSPDVIILKDGNGKWLKANRSCTEFFGLAGNDYHGKTSEALGEILSPRLQDALKICTATDIEILASKTPYRKVEILPGPDGSKRHIDVVKIPIPYSNEGQNGLLVIGRDVTALKEAELEREKIKAQLYQKQKMELLGTFASGIAHDFNNILTAIMSRLELAVMHADQDNPLCQSCLKTYAYAEKGAKLVEQILRFSRQDVVNLKIVDLDDIILNHLEMLSRLVPEHIIIETELNAQSDIMADARTLEQVMMNLIINANTAMKKGGCITITTKKVTIDEQKSNTTQDAYPDEFVCLSVIDSGCGIDDETRLHIFEPFFTTKSENEGTGLGLSVVHGIVKQHNGWITLESKIGVGTTFSVFFPAIKGSQQKKDFEGQILCGIDGKEQKILVVEDDPKILQMLKNLLDYQNIIVFPATTHQGAEEIFPRENGNFSLILLDPKLSDSAL